jgi:glutathione peroxidase
MTVYEITAKDIGGRDVTLADYKGKVLLVVNTATGCGFTPQYEGLQSLYGKYRERGFEVLDFPCNQFGHQAPGTEEEIVSFCQSRYDVSFPQFAKIEVNGANEHPLYTFLKAQKGGVFGDNIKWNFTKFLINKDGAVIKRYAPTVTPNAIDGDIARLLESGND